MKSKDEVLGKKEYSSGKKLVVKEKKKKIGRENISSMIDKFAVRYA